MLDNKTRKLMSGSIRSFRTSRINNEQLDDVLFGMTTSDDLCLQIRRQMYLLYDDNSIYKNEGRMRYSSQVELMLTRWEMLLETDLEWWAIIRRKPPTGFFNNVRLFLSSRFAPSSKVKGNFYWPLRSEGEWNSMICKSNSDPK